MEHESRFTTLSTSYVHIVSASASYLPYRLVTHSLFYVVSAHISVALSHAFTTFSPSFRFPTRSSIDCLVVVWHFCHFRFHLQSSFRTLQPLLRWHFALPSS